MNRRLVLKQLAVATAAAWILPSCVSDPKKISIALNRLNINGDDEALLAAIADTLIPKTDTPGALEVNAHLFTIVMVDDCQTKTDQDKYVKGLRGFDDVCKRLAGKTFTNASAEERTDILKKIDAAKDDLSDEVRTFYNTTRRYTIEGYTASQYFMTDVKAYQLIPGPHFKGCVPVEKVKVIS
jgi:hypothetical protein